MRFSIHQPDGYWYLANWIAWYCCSRQLPETRGNLWDFIPPSDILLISQWISLGNLDPLIKEFLKVCMWQEKPGSLAPRVFSRRLGRGSREAGRSRTDLDNGVNMSVYLPPQASSKKNNRGLSSLALNWVLLSKSKMVLLCAHDGIKPDSRRCGVSCECTNKDRCATCMWHMPSSKKEMYIWREC